MLALEVREAIRKRRSIRKFKPYDLPKDKLLEILEAARLSPSYANTQPWRFIVVEDEAVKRKLAEVTAHRFLAEASVTIAVLGNEKLAGSSGGIPKRSWLDMDIGAAIENMLLQATELGLATCLDGSFRQREVKRVLKVPEQVRSGDWRVMVLLSVGLAGEEPAFQERKPLEQLVYLNEFGKPHPGV
ncbi:MAG: nitroreductase family protein [Candidatus Brockarchaeota archaeon]|nr:nitroreductase family protein [Candidatus Brockarchaeota archaeon]